jgi:galactokinase
VTRLDASHVMQSLLIHGLSEHDAIARSAVVLRCDAALTSYHAGLQHRATIWVPGRIELFGKHTDYAGGRSLLMATERGFVFRVAPRNDQTVRVWDLSKALYCELPLAADLTTPEGDWSHYVATVVRRLVSNFPEVSRGADIAFFSDLPPAAGASSSTALMIGVSLSLLSVNDVAKTERFRELFPSPEAFATYLGAMEMGGAFGSLTGDAGVGTLGGCQDQTAILCAHRDMITDAVWLPTRLLGAHAFPARYTFVVGASGVAAEKTAGAKARYNRVSLMVRHLLHEWNHTTERADVSLGAAVRSADDAPAQLRALAKQRTTAEFSATALTNRVEQFLLETQSLIPAAVTAMAAHRWSDLGELSRQSHEAADRWLGNQIDETNALVVLAREHGALAASAFGAGFGGSVWAMVERERADEFQDVWGAVYRKRFPRAGAHAIFFATRPGAPAGSWQELADVS